LYILLAVFAMLHNTADVRRGIANFLHPGSFPPKLGDLLEGEEGEEGASHADPRERMRSNNNNNGQPSSVMVTSNSAARSRVPGECSEQSRGQSSGQSSGQISGQSNRCASLTLRADPGDQSVIGQAVATPVALNASMPTANKVPLEPVPLEPRFFQQVKQANWDADTLNRACEAAAARSDMLYRAIGSTGSTSSTSQINRSHQQDCDLHASPSGVLLHAKRPLTRQAREMDQAFRLRVTNGFLERVRRPKARDELVRLAAINRASVRAHRQAMRESNDNGSRTLLKRWFRALAHAEKHSDFSGPSGALSTTAWGGGGLAVVQDAEGNWITVDIQQGDAGFAGGRDIRNVQNQADGDNTEGGAGAGLDRKVVRRLKLEEGMQTLRHRKQNLEHRSEILCTLETLLWGRGGRAPRSDDPAATAASSGATVSAHTHAFDASRPGETLLRLLGLISLLLTAMCACAWAPLTLLYWVYSLLYPLLHFHRCGATDGRNDGFSSHPLQCTLTLAYMLCLAVLLALAPTVYRFQKLVGVDLLKVRGMPEAFYSPYTVMELQTCYLRAWHRHERDDLLQRRFGRWVKKEILKYIDEREESDIALASSLQQHQKSQQRGVDSRSHGTHSNQEVEMINISTTNQQVFSIDC